MNYKKPVMKNKISFILIYLKSNKIYSKQLYSNQLEYLNKGKKILNTTS